MQIFVKSVGGKIVTIDVTDDTITIKMLKSLVEAKEGTLSDEQRIYFGGKVLADDDATLGDYFIKDGSNLQLVVRLLGGANN
ncbi:unnamed protein product [Arabidopsis lyrata]|nr:unnamed protein product [Arabidopsis lyrata]